MHTHSPHPTSRVRSLLGGSLGNLVEWYDWFVYSAFALYFAPSFFASDDRLTQLLGASGVFALGFFMRPAGGWLLALIADRHGRRFALTLSVALMCLGSALIAVVPTYATIGIAAPIILTLARMLQGVSVGGEFGTSATYLAEIAQPERRGFWGSFQYLTLIMGQLLALAVLLLLRTVMDDAQLREWGWRIPFAIGGVLAVVVFWIRNGMEESRDFLETKHTATNTGVRMLLRQPRLVAIVFLMAAGGNVAFYTFTTYMQKYLVVTHSFTTGKASAVMAAALIVFMLAQPLGGALSDRIGRKPLLYFFGIGGAVLFPVILHALRGAIDGVQAFALICAALLLIAGNASVSATVKAELFKPNVRALGVGLPYALSLSIFGGTAEYVALWMKERGTEEWYAIYLSVLVLLSLAAFVAIPETRPRRN